MYIILHAYTFMHVMQRICECVRMHGWVCIMWNPALRCRVASRNTKCNAAQRSGMHLCMYLCMCTAMYVSICNYICLYVYLYICLYVSMYVSMYLWMSLCVNIMECLAMNRTVNTTKTCMYRCMYDSHMIYVYEMQRNIIACCAFMRLWISVSLACVCKDVCHTCVHMHLC